MTVFDTWLTDADVERLWAVCHGTLPEIYASSEEIDEFARLVTHSAMIKLAVPDYSQAIVQ